jgi:acyl-ACP thioesterase
MSENVTNVPPVYEMPVQVGIGAADTSSRLTLYSIFDYFQDAACFHAEALGCGKFPLLERRQGWVLSRMSVVVDKRPVYFDQITVRSWPRGSEKLFALRDYDIRDASGAAVVRSRSAWLIWDIDKRRPLRSAQIVETLPLNDGLNALDYYASLEARPEMQKVSERRCLYSDMDYNGHMNNARYLQWIQDAPGSDALEQAARMKFDINYVAEIHRDETVSLCMCELPKDTGDNSACDCARAYEGRREDGTPVFRAELRTWN